MRIAYFDCTSGIAGNMALGALIDCGVSAKHLNKELKKLKLKNWKLVVKKVKTNGVKATFADVKIKGKEKQRHLKDILSVINKSSLSKNIKTKSSGIFRRLAEAESRVHGEPLSQLHFHEVGATDAIIDIVGTVIGLEALGVQEIYSSPINVGSGKVYFSHGTFPVPAPATAQLLSGIPAFSTDTRTEVATPTGVAIITALAKSFGDLPRICLESTGLGAGSKKIKGLSGLMLFIGEKELKTTAGATLMLETNLDDMNPKHFDKAIKGLMKAGALDAYFQPLRMKKKRNAVKLTALCLPHKKDKVLKAFFDETPTLGVRLYLVKRETLERAYLKLKTKWGKVKIKAGKLEGKIKTLSPEFEDLKKIASKHRTPLASVLKELSFNY